jgi:capsular exopolysaccharide synthesis family protein
LPGCGTTTVATNLAAANAAAGRRVLLVDANFRRPRLAEAVGQNEAGPGLGDLLACAASLDQVIVPVSEGIDLIRAGTPANRVFERLQHGGKFDSVMAQLRESFDLIIIDTPPAVVAGDALGIASKVDAAVLVVRASQEQRGLVARLINQLGDAQCELIGVLLNRARGTAGGYFKKNFATMADYARSPRN